MTETIAYRGPDQTGYYFDDHASIGHLRLKIIDLSENAAQPMSNEDDSLILVFNGEIYNFVQLRRSLEQQGHRFKSLSDTEVIIHAYEQYGTDCAALFEGMFAFMIWDPNKKIFFGARDHAGIKPLYYHCYNGKFIFASEAKAILQVPGIERKIDETALSCLIDNLFVKGNKTLFTGIFKLPPGNQLIFNTLTHKLEISPYWQPILRPTKMTLDEASDLIDAVLANSVQNTLISDVPLGIALSGGLDSSLLAALAAKKTSLKTFTAGFGVETDEFSYARAVAEHIGSDHTELHISLSGLTESIPEMIWHLESPPTRTAVMPTLLLGKEMRRQVTVTLLGEGGDELFGGYERHLQFATKTFNGNEKLLDETFFKKNEKPDYFTLKTALHPPGTRMSANLDYKNEYLNQALLYDFQNQLPGVQLNRVDKLTMASSIEARVPFLNRSVIEAAFTIPSALKSDGKTEKIVLKNLGTRYLPKKITSRKKVGMQTPLSEWFDSEFLELCNNILDEKNIRDISYLNATTIRKTLKKNNLLRRLLPPKTTTFKLNVARNYYAGKLWFLSMLTIWHKLYIEPEKFGKTATYPNLSRIL